MKPARKRRSPEARLGRLFAPWWPTARARVAGVRGPRSLRLRLALWYGGLLLVALGIFAMLVLTLTTQSIEAGVESAIEAQARVAMLDLNHQLLPAPPYWPGQLMLNAVDTYRDPGVTVEVIGDSGQVLYRSGSDGATALATGHTLERQALRGQVGWATLRVDNESVRLEALPISAPASANTAANGTASTSPPVIGVLLVAKSLEDVDNTLALLRTLLLGAGILTLAGALAGGWAIAGRVLRPLAELGATAADIIHATRQGTRLVGLSRRVPHPGGQDELAQVVDSVNEMLASLESATTAQRRFVADASHELRAPLTTIQGNLAFLQQHGEDLPVEERQVMLADAHAEAQRLARLVDDLLLLARSDARAETPIGAEVAPLGVSSVTSESPVEVDREIVTLVRSLRGRLQAEGRHTRIEIERIEPARVRADRETIRRIALILLDNAIKYSHSYSHSFSQSPHAESGPPRQETVAVALRSEGHEAVLSVTDNGVGIAPGDLPHIFERFYRADRARDRSGSGLGLAIAAELVERLGGTIAVESTIGKGSVFRVRLPLAEGTTR